MENNMPTINTAIKDAPDMYMHSNSQLETIPIQKTKRSTITKECHLISGFLGWANSILAEFLCL